jgi:fumarate reductase flavoprotein subunit
MGDESIGYSGFAPVVAGVTSESWVVFDQRIRDYVASHEPEFAELVAIGGVVEAEDENAVAARIGAPVDNVRESLRAYREAALGRANDPHGRADFGMAPLEPPYFVVRSIPAIFHTQGGALVDDQGRVLTTEGTPVPGLFAGGGVTAGVSGAAGATGYSSGNGLLSAIGLGRLAGAAAAREDVPGALA